MTLFFDGVCNLCSGLVQFVIRHDRRATVHFAALQSDIGQRVLASLGRPLDDLDTFVLYDHGAFHVRSTAALKTAGHLDGTFKLLRALVIVPRPLRDLAYRLVAARRYRWFGRGDQCWLPTPELRARFVA